MIKITIEVLHQYSIGSTIYYVIINQKKEEEKKEIDTLDLLVQGDYYGVSLSIWQGIKPVS